MRYSAFISYNYSDRRFAIRLHLALEHYRIPKQLRDRPAPWGGTLGTRLPPVFRDRDELAASANLGEAVQAALSESQTLIVICSPRAAASRWVNEEIRTFIALGRRDHIRCLIVDGEPHAADPSRECLPPALFEDGGSEPLAADLRRHQDGWTGARLKLLSGMLGVAYDELRQRETARRHRRMAALASASAISFLIMTGLFVFALVARGEAVKQRDIARQRTLTAERTVDFVKSMFEVSDPSEARGRTITAREILDRGAERIRRGLTSEPTVQAELGVTLGEVYGSLGLYRRAQQLLDWTSGIRHVDQATTIRQLLVSGDARRNEGEYEQAIASYRRGITLARKPGGQRLDLLARLLIGLAEAQSAVGDDRAAERSAREALRLNLARLGPNDPEVARDLQAMGNNAYFMRDYARARQLVERALVIYRRTEGPDSPGLSDAINMLGSIAREEGRLAAAEDYYRSRLAIDEKVLGRNHPDLATSLNNLGRVLIDRRRFGEGEQLLARAVTIDLREREDHDDMAYHFSNLALAKDGLGKHREAVPLLERALQVARLHQHPETGMILSYLAAHRCDEGNSARGLAMIAEARKLDADSNPGEQWRAAWMDNVEGACRNRAGQRSEAAALLGRSTKTILSRWRADTMYGSIARQRLAAATTG